MSGNFKVKFSRDHTRVTDENGSSTQPRGQRPVRGYPQVPQGPLLRFPQYPQISGKAKARSLTLAWAEK